MSTTFLSYLLKFLFFSIYSLPFHFVYNYFDYLGFLSDIIGNSLLKHRNEAAERNTDESRMWSCKQRDAVRKKTENGVESGQ